MDMLSDVMIDKPTQSTTPKTDSGFTLIEVMIAMAIFAFGLLALAALQIAAIKLSSDSQYVTQANLLANEMVGMMWGTQTASLVSNYNDLAVSAAAVSVPATSTSTIVADNSSAWRDHIVSQLPGGTGRVSVSNINQATVTLSWEGRTGRRSYSLSDTVRY